MTASRIRPGGRPLIGDPADLAAECREIRRLRAQVEAVLAWCDLADEQNSVLHTSTIRAALRAAAAEALDGAA